MANRDFDKFLHCLLFSSCEHELKLLSDQQLLRRYTGQHDEFAVGEVIRRHGAMVWAICRRMLGRSQDAKDVYQVVFLKLIRKAALVQQCPSVESWLHRVVRNVASNARSKRDPLYVRGERGVQMHEEGYAEPQDTRDLADIVDEELSYLPEKCQRPIILCYLEGLTHEQAADRVRISTRCLKRLLAEGRQRLHQRLSRRGIHLDAPRLVAELTSSRQKQKVPPGLMERTLDMARIVAQSNSVLATPSIGDEVTLLLQRAWQSWALPAKLLLGFLLVILMLAGGSLITYSGWWSFRGEQPQERIPGPAKKVKPKPEIHETPSSRTDDHALPPLGAGLPTPPLDDRRSPPPARRGSPDPAARRPQVSPPSHGPDWMPSWNDTSRGETYGRHGGGVGRPAPSGGEHERRHTVLLANRVDKKVIYAIFIC